LQGAAKRAVTYVRELRSSKTCFSPFGYGEICWRDIEAFAYGAVLIKPDMSHLETCPDIYVPGVTYLPVNWDFSNLQEVVDMALASPDLCRSIAQEAHRRITQYLQTARFVQDMSFLVA
jgi:Glycosyl transferases group 1